MKRNYRTIRLMMGVAFTSLIAAGLSSCGKKDANSPGVEFMPDMYRSPSLEYYSSSIFEGDTINTAMMPVKYTIARGFLPYAYANTPEGYELAGSNLHNPLSVGQREQWETEGEVLFGKYCVHCHGATGAGDGKVAAKLPGAPPAYNSAAIKNLPEGKIFHSITYGKGLMGAHNSLLSVEERWKLVCFVQKLQGPKDMAVDSTKKTATAPPVVEVKK